MRRPQSEKLESAFSRAEARCADLRDEDQARMAQLMTIWASGYLEVVCQETLTNFAQKRSVPEVAQYVRSQLRWFQNPNMDRITRLVGEFDRGKAESLRTWAEGPVAESVNSIRNLRNQIAHGRLPGVSVVGIVGHFRNARKLANRLVTLFR